MKRIKYENLLPGDIVLTASNSKTGKIIRTFSNGDVSHALICVQVGSLIDSTKDGVQSRNPQRELFSDDENIFVFRLKSKIEDAAMRKITDYARSQIGTRYSTQEALRTKVSALKPRNRQQFCSRLVARAYAEAGIQLVSDPDYCTPEDIRNSDLLIELQGFTQEVDTEEQLQLDRMAKNSFPQLMQESTNVVLKIARKFDPKIENLHDIDILVRDRPEIDTDIVNAYIDSGYVSLWQTEVNTHPYRYDLNLMNTIQSTDDLTDLREYCRATIREFYTGGTRFATNLVFYQKQQRETPRKTYCIMMSLYTKLVEINQKRVETAYQWLFRNFPNDIPEYIEKIEPHSDLWFYIVDQVEPHLSILARACIKQEGSKDVCSSCGDTPVRDYKLMDAAKDMPGVPSLRLCDDCIIIRRDKFGESLELLN